MSIIQRSFTIADNAGNMLYQESFDYRIQRTSDSSTGRLVIILTPFIGSIKPGTLETLSMLFFSTVDGVVTPRSFRFCGMDEGYHVESMDYQCRSQQVLNITLQCRQAMQWDPRSI